MSAHKIALTLALGLLSLGLLACQGDTIVSPNAGSEGIHVSGQASVSATPDIAQTQLGVQTFAASVDKALQTNNTRMDAIVAALKAQGVADADLQTSNFNVQPQYDFEKETRDIVGYWVNNSLAVTLRDLDQVGTALQAALDAGANTVNDLRFTIDDGEALQSEARALAVADARQRAETLAAAAGVKLGAALDIRESSGSYPIFARGSFDEASGAAVPVQAGALDLTVYVEVLFAIR
jgi:uncharacterized protein YggE